MNIDLISDVGRFRSIIGELVYECYSDAFKLRLIQDLGQYNRDVEVFIVDCVGFSNQLDRVIRESSKLKVFWVLNVTKSSLPYLKYADAIYFTDEKQLRLYDMVFEHTTYSWVVPLELPKVQNLPPKDPKSLSLLIAWHYQPFEHSSLIKQIKKTLEAYKNIDIQVINLVFQFPLERSRKFISLVKKIFDGLEVRVLTGETDAIAVKQAICQSQFAEVFEDAPLNDPFALISNPEMKFEIRTLDYNLSARSMHRLIEVMGSQSLGGTINSHRYQGRPVSEFIDLNQIQTRLPSLDQLDDLNIIHGRPLTNRFVLSILMRNVGEKIDRCLQSVLALQKHHDVGVVVIDDCSDDDSAKRAETILKRESMDSIVVRNTDRKYAAKNYRNVIHLLVENDDSIIIDLDGDDFLNDQFDVFAVLGEAYSDQFTLKTIGSFKTIADDQTSESDDRKGLFCSIFQGYQLLNDSRNPHNQFRCQAWLHLRTAKRSLLKQVEQDYFVERRTMNWLKTDHDSSIGARAMELAGPKNVKYLSEELYVYDISGNDHDFMSKQGKDTYDIVHDLSRVFVFDNIDRDSRR